MKIISILTILLITSCGLIEDDTKLLCKCDRLYEDYKSKYNKKPKNCDLFNINDMPLTFNNSSKKFLFGTDQHIDSTFKKNGAKVIRFRDNFIDGWFPRRSLGGTSFSFYFDRESKVYYESFTRLNGYSVRDDGRYPNWGPQVRVYYQCRVNHQ